LKQNKKQKSHISLFVIHFQIIKEYIQKKNFNLYFGYFFDILSLKDTFTNSETQKLDNMAEHLNTYHVVLFYNYIDLKKNKRKLDRTFTIQYELNMYGLNCGNVKVLM
jgi:hypothetical protein